MTPTKRQQLEQRLAQLDDAILTLRRGFAREGRCPPEVCTLMQEERNDIAQLLCIDRALDAQAQRIEWSSEQQERTSSSGASCRNPSGWERSKDFLRTILGDSRNRDSARE